MPGLVHKISICATVDGLSLHPVGAKHKDAESLSISYGSNSKTKIKTIQRGGSSTDKLRSVEGYGIVGIKRCP